MRRSTARTSSESIAARALELATVVARPAGPRASDSSPHGPGGASDAQGRRQAGPARSGRPVAHEPALRILVAAPHAATRTALRVLVEQAGFDLCGECRSAEEAVASAAAECPQVCVLDADLEGGGAFAAATEIALLPSHPKVVIVAASKEPAAFFAAIRAGADSYLAGMPTVTKLADALSTVAAGEAFLEPALVTHLVQEARAQRWRPAGELTPREGEVLALLRRRLSTKQAAAELGIAPTTVRRHVSTALRKLGVADRAAGLARLPNVHTRRERK